jgi:hypothetical protein
VRYVGSVANLNASFNLLIGSYLTWFVVLSCMKWCEPDSPATPPRSDKCVY